MNDETTDGAVLEVKLVGDIAGSFRVARYQRGYRWGTPEVERLLDDIRDSNGAPYSLQPVVVKRDGDGTWELVDGQQRLTTLFLIFSYMQRASLKNVAPQYTITYDTKTESGDYLRDLDPALANRNIDFFHLNAAYVCIEAWFVHNGPTPLKRQSLADDIFGYLCKSVRVIWYEAPEGLDATTLFTRLNVGRIPLTDAELFKALLLSGGSGRTGITDRALELAAQWDTIERDLQRPDVWAFVADDEASASPTRITLLLDTLAGGPRGRDRPRFHSFEALREQGEKRTLESVWNDVVRLHALVLGWYENRAHYHKVGYLVAVGQRFSDLVALAIGKAKSELGTILDGRIRDTLDLTPSEVSSLSYESDSQKCLRVLLLMNVETVQRMTNSSERYSFRMHRNQAWSLEHIHAQHGESLTTDDQWREWLRLHRDALTDLPSIDRARRDELLRRIDAVGDTLDRQGFRVLARDVTVAFSVTDASPLASAHSMHSLSNLALLANGHNSALNNAVFEVKRRRVLELDRHGAYIPVCTRQVFLKYYADADAQQIHFWSPQDREAYLAAILSRDSGVGVYLKPEVPAS